VQEAPQRPSFPHWTESATNGTAFARGARAVTATPGAYILVLGMLGFGALCRDLGFSILEAAFVTGAIFQLPGMVAFVDELGRSASIGAAAIAIMLTAIRLLPMTVVLQPYLRGSTLPRWVDFYGAHFVAITSWVEALRRLPELPDRLRMPFYIGFGTTLCSLTMVATAIGYQVSGSVPTVVSGALLFLTPVYFATSLLSTATGVGDKLSLAIGAALGPVFFALAPGFDLVLTGLIGGTAAYFISRRIRASASSAPSADKNRHRSDQS